jgi:hypothetical protein
MPEDQLTESPEQQGAFTVELPLEKAWTDDDGSLRWRCLASTGSVDADDDFMAKACLEDMATQTGVLVHGSSHRERPEKAYGEVQRWERAADNVLAEGIFYPWVPEAVTMHHQMTTGVRNYAVSVGGKITAKGPRGFDPTLGKAVREIRGVKLDHLFFCQPQEARNPDTFVEALHKAALDAPEETPMDTIEKASTDLTETLAEEQGESMAQEAAWATGDMMEALNETLGQIMAQDIPEADKRALVDQAMADFGEKLCEKLWIDQPMPELAKAEPTEQEAQIMSEDTNLEATAEPEAEAVEAPAAAPEVTEGTPASEPDAEIVAEALAEDETPAEADAESAPEATSEQPEGEMTPETPAEEADPEAGASPDEPEADLGKARVAQLEEDLAKAQARIAELEGQPLPGGPVSPAAEEPSRLEKATPEGPTFAGLVGTVRENMGTVAGEQARRAAHGKVVDALALGMTRAAPTPPE